MMMTSLCKESVHSFFLGLTNTTHMDNNKQGLGLVTATDDDACRTLTPSPPPLPLRPPTSSLFSLFSKKDPGGIGFIDDMGGGVDGLMSCTESLGFESSDERIDHNQTAEMYAVTNYNQPSSSKIGWRKDHHHHHHHHHHVVKKFPPPLSSFTRNGRPSFFLRSVRSDGRLELTEVMTDRKEILRASREDGRLRLHLIREDEDNNNNNEVDMDSEHNEYEQDEETLEPEEQEDEDEETLEPEEEEEEEEEGEEEEKGVGESKLERLSRCNEMIGHQHHHQRHPHHRHDHLHVWSHQCVPTR